MKTTKPSFRASWKHFIPWKLLKCLVPSVCVPTNRKINETYCNESCGLLCRQALFFLSFPGVLCCTLGIERHVFSPKLNVHQNRVKVFQNDFFIFKIGTRQIGHRLHCVAQCKQAQTWEQGEKTTLFSRSKQILHFNGDGGTCVSGVVILRT